MTNRDAFSILSDIQTETYTLRCISQLVNAMHIAMEKSDNMPETLMPGLFAIHCQLNDFADMLDTECNAYFDDLQEVNAKHKVLTDEEIVARLKENPELIPQVMQILTQGKPELHPAG